jgi:hypothetical protein
MSIECSCISAVLVIASPPGPSPCYKVSMYSTLLQSLYVFEYNKLRVVSGTISVSP